MDSLTLDAAEAIASLVPDERDIASLRCTCKLWRDFYALNDGLWCRLVEQRFGTASVPQNPSHAPAAFKRLAQLQSPVKDGSVCWLGTPENYLEGERHGSWAPHIRR